MLSKNPQVHILFHVSCFESAMYGKIHTRKFNFPNDQSFVLVVPMVLGDFSLWGIFQVRSPEKYKTFQMRCLKKTINLGKCRSFASEIPCTGKRGKM